MLKIPVTICMQYLTWYLLWCWYAGSSLEVKIETDSNDAMAIKTEDDRNDITECLHGDKQVIGILKVYSLHDDSISTGMFSFIFRCNVIWFRLWL